MRFQPLLLGVLLFLLNLIRAQDNRQPNILFIMSDDHAYQAISAYQDRLIRTPNIDRIASEGMRFTNACVSNSICAPSRAAILTGKHSHVNGKVDNIQPFDTTQVTFPQLFQQAGYQTAMFGKLHFGNDPKGIDQFKILPGQGHYYNPDFITKDSGQVRVQGYVTDIITENTLDWLREERKEEQPFLLFYLHKAPHREWLPAARHHREYAGRNFPEPPTLFDDYQGRGTAAREAEMNLLDHMNWVGDSKLRPEVLDELGIEPGSDWDKDTYQWNILDRMDSTQLANWKETYEPMIADFRARYPSMSEEDLMRWRYNRYMQDYLACIEAVDEGVGEVLDYLEESGLAENTIVVYTSDQGFYLGEHGWFDKRFIYNESFKTPLLVGWPEVVQAGSVTTEMVQNIDFAPTFLEAAGIAIPEDMHGESIVPLLNGNTGEWDREAVYYHYYEYPAIHMVKRHYGIVSEDFKLIHFYDDVDEWELYDRKKDSLELNNVYDHPRYAGVVRRLKRKLYELREQYGDSDELDRYYMQRHRAHMNRGE